MKCKHCGGLLDPTQKKHFDGSYYCVGNRTHAEPEESLSTPQPDPVKNEGPAVWELVIADMHERDQIGEQRYGVRLQAGNGRDALVDAYQEGLDLAVYLRQEIEERFKIIFQIVGWLADAGIQMPERAPGRSVQLNAILSDIQLAIRDLQSIKSERDTLLRERKGEVWIWSTGSLEDGDNAALITCPILIQPETLHQYLVEKLPIPMVLHCPRCGAQHVDKIEGLDEYHQRVKNTVVGPGGSPPPRWENPPHKSHLCAKCKCIWRPADISTVGVDAIVSRGEKDTWP